MELHRNVQFDLHTLIQLQLAKLLLVLPNFDLINNYGVTADTDLLKMVPVEIMLNFVKYFCTLQLGF